MKYKVFYKNQVLMEYDTVVECIDCVKRMLTILNGGATKEDFAIYCRDTYLMELV